MISSLIQNDSISVESESCHRSICIRRHYCYYFPYRFFICRHNEATSIIHRYMINHTATLLFITCLSIIHRIAYYYFVVWYCGHLFMMYCKLFISFIIAYTSIDGSNLKRSILPSKVFTFHRNCCCYQLLPNNIRFHYYYNLLNSTHQLYVGRNYVSFLSSTNVIDQSIVTQLFIYRYRQDCYDLSFVIENYNNSSIVINIIMNRS